MAQLERQPADINLATGLAVPPGFDARKFPIIARHHFGLEPPPPWQHISSPLARIIDRLRVVDEIEDAAA